MTILGFEKQCCIRDLRMISRKRGIVILKPWIVIDKPRIKDD